MSRVIRIGTRDSQLAVWQATTVQNLLKERGYSSELVYVKSEGDIDLTTPLYEMGVQGVFTKTLDIALLKEDVDIAVHSMKDVPTQLAKGISSVAVLPRASYKDILVLKGSDTSFLDDRNSIATIATSSVRRKAQWLNRYPNHIVESLRGNVNTRLQKVKDNTWQGAIFADAGLSRINLKPTNAVSLDWMLPAPAQGAIMVVGRTDDQYIKTACFDLNDEPTEICTQAERSFLRGLMGGCATPISALAEVNGGSISFKGNLLSLDGKEVIETEISSDISDAIDIGKKAAQEILSSEVALRILNDIRSEGS